MEILTKTTSIFWLHSINVVCKYFIIYYLSNISCVIWIFFSIRIRQKTWERLKAIKGGTFTKILQEMLDIHESMNIITVPHYHALERRLKIVYTVATMCQKKSNESILKQL